MSVSIDANVLVYTTDQSDPSRHVRAIAVYTAMMRSSKATLTEQALWEFMNVAVRRRFLTRSDALSLVEAWARLIPVVFAGVSTIAETASLLRSTNLHIWDARLLATCGVCGVHTILSEDMQDGGQYGSVRVLNPFNPANDKIIDALLT